MYICFRTVYTDRRAVSGLCAGRMNSIGGCFRPSQADCRNYALYCEEAVVPTSPSFQSVWKNSPRGASMRS